MYILTLTIFKTNKRKSSSKEKGLLQQLLVICCHSFSCPVTLNCHTLFLSVCPLHCRPRSNRPSQSKQNAAFRPADPVLVVCHQPWVFPESCVILSKNPLIFSSLRIRNSSISKIKCYTYLKDSQVPLATFTQIKIELIHSSLAKEEMILISIFT